MHPVYAIEGITDPVLEPNHFSDNNLPLYPVAPSTVNLANVVDQSSATGAMSLAICGLAFCIALVFVLAGV